MPYRRHLLAGAIAALSFITAQAQGTAMDKTPLLTRQAFDVKIMANGRDVTATSPVAFVKYNADGSGMRALKDGKTVSGSWRFLNPQQTQIEVQGPEGSSRWVIIHKVCKEFVLLCRRMKLFTDGIVAIDGSKFKAVTRPPLPKLGAANAAVQPPSWIGSIQSQEAFGADRLRRAAGLGGGDGLASSIAVKARC